MFNERIPIKTLEFSRSSSPQVQKRQVLNSSLRKYAKPIVFQDFNIEDKILDKIAQNTKLKPSFNISKYSAVLQLLYNQSLKESPKRKIRENLNSTYYAPSVRVASPLRPKSRPKKLIRTGLAQAERIEIEGRPFSRLAAGSKSNSPEPKICKTFEQQT